MIINATVGRGSDVGIIFDLEYETHEGLKYYVDCGGFACHREFLTGAYVPICTINVMKQALDKHFLDDDKYGGWCCDGIDEQTADFIDALLAGIKFEVDGMPLLTLRVDRCKLKKCQEAWIHLITSQNTEAVLVWQNSD